MKKKDLTSHRIIEKRRRDRMNNCLADLSKLIPDIYLKKRSGRVEKTEIIEMAIKYLKDLIENSKASQPQDSNSKCSTIQVGDEQNCINSTQFQDDKSPSPSRSSTSSSLASTSATIGSSVNNDDFQLYPDFQEVSLLSLSSSSPSSASASSQQQQQPQQQLIVTNGLSFINQHNNHHSRQNQHLLHQHHVASSSSLSSQTNHQFSHTDRHHHHLHHNRHHNHHHQNSSSQAHGCSKASLQQRQPSPNSSSGSDSRGSNRSISSGSLSAGSTSSSSLSNGLMRSGGGSGSSGYCCCDAKILSTSHSTGNLSNVGDIDSNHTIANRARYTNSTMNGGLNLYSSSHHDAGGLNGTNGISDDANCMQQFSNNNNSSRAATNNGASPMSSGNHDNGDNNSYDDDGKDHCIAFSNSNTMVSRGQNQDAGNENTSIVPDQNRYNSRALDYGGNSSDTSNSNSNNGNSGSQMNGYSTSNSEYPSNLSSTTTRSTSSLSGWSKKAWLVRSFSRSSTSQR